MTQWGPAAKGLLLMVVASSCFGIMGAAAKQASLTLTYWETTFWRALVTVVLTSVMLWSRRQAIGDTGDERRLWLWLRGFVGTIGLVLYFYAIAHIPLAEAMMLNNTAPVFTTLLAAVFLGERLQAHGIAALAVALVGVYLVLQPGGSGGIDLGVWLGLLSGLFAGLAQVLIKRLSGQEPWRVVWHLAAVGVVVSLPGSLQNLHPLSGSLPVAILVMGIAATLAQGSMTTAYHHLRAGAASTAGLMTVAAGAFMGWLWFGETLRPQALGGGALILLGGIGAGWTPRRLLGPPRPPGPQFDPIAAPEDLDRL